MIQNKTITEQDSREDSQDFLLKYRPSPLHIKRNKLNMKWMSLNYKKKIINISLHPFSTIDGIKPADRKRILNCKEKFGTRKMKLRLTRNNLSLNNNFTNKIKMVSNSLFQIYAVNENLNKIFFSLGSLVELRLGMIKKIVLITHFQEMNKLMEQLHEPVEKINFYALNIHNDSFLKFFDEINKITWEAERKHFFLYGGVHQFKLVNLDTNSLFLNKIFNNKSKIENNIDNINFLIFEAPQRIIENVNYSEIPVINLSGKNDFKSRDVSNKKNLLSKNSEKIVFLSTHLNYKHNTQNFLKINNFLNDNYTIFDNKLKVNFGELINKQVIKSSSHFGGVGSLILNKKDLKHPLGINIGAKNESSNEINYMLSFENEKVKLLLEEFILLSNKNMCV